MVDIVCMWGNDIREVALDTAFYLEWRSLLVEEEDEGHVNITDDNTGERSSPCRIKRTDDFS